MSTEKEKQAESLKAASAQNGQGESSDQTQVAATATETEKVPESKEQVAAPKAAASPAKEDESGKQVAAVQPPAEPEKGNGVQKEVKAKTPEEIVDDYLGKLGAIDIRATVVKGRGAPEQETGAEAKPDEGADKPQVIHWLDEVAKDVTPVVVTKSCQASDKGRLLGDQSLFREFQNIDGILNDESKTVEARLDQSTGLLTTFCAYYNFADHKFKAIFADYAIMIGKFLVVMKAFVQGVRKTNKEFPNWGAWAAENLSFLGERRRQDYMALAERPDAHSYSYFGVERLLHLVKITESISGSDKIGTFLRQHNITFDPGDEDIKVREFKCQVDAALFVQKAKENSLDLDFTWVKSLIEIGAEVDRKMISDCKQIADSGGDPNKYLQARFKNKGKEIDYWMGEKIVSNLIALGKRLEKGCAQLERDPGSLIKLQISELEPLLSAITRLKEARSKIAPPPTGEDNASGSEKE